MAAPITPPQLIAALGNPGPQYRMTRHNVGMLFFEYWGLSQQGSWKQKFKGLWQEVKTPSVHLLQPQTYMNLSGESILPLAQFYKIAPQAICVIHDEIDLPLGTMEFRLGGGLAGHNGLKSTASQLGTKDFYRLRLGVGRPDHPGHSVSDWVLGQFSKVELNELKPIFERSELALGEWLAGQSSFQQIQQKYNLRKKG